jgi:glycosyltransferase involved in cell wall biosynthesis
VRKIKVGLFGTRGVPASYSGFETFYDKLIRRLSKEEFDLIIFNRTNYLKYPFFYFKGAKVVQLPSIPQKHLDTISHTLLSLIWCATQNIKLDIALICIVGNSPLLPFFKALGMKTVINVDGQDWRREKWGKFASSYLRASEILASKFADIIVADALEVKKYYESFTYDKNKIVYIPYGGLEDEDLKRCDLWGDDGEFLKKFGLEKNKYFLFVGRLVPENAPNKIIKAFINAKNSGRIPNDMKLVIVGDAPYSSEYKKYLFEISKGNPSVIFTGYIFSTGYIKLSRNAFSFVLCATVGGTHPVLVEQMSLGNLIICYDTPSNREVLEDAGFYFSDEKELENLLEHITKIPENERTKKQKTAKELAKTKYSWDKIAEEYRNLFLSLSRK